MYVLSGAGGWPAEVGGTPADWRYRRQGGQYEIKGMKAGNAQRGWTRPRTGPNRTYTLFPELNEPARPTAARPVSPRTTFLPVPALRAFTTEGTVTF